MAFVKGVNYNYNPGGTLGTFTTDMTLLKRYGINAVRLLIPDYDASSTITTWRTYVQQALSQGMYVIYGVTYPADITTGKWITTQNWSAYTSGVISEATWAATLGTNQLEFQIGNELERQRFVKISSLTQTGGTATAVCTFAHQFISGATVTIRYASPAAYNSTHVITVVNSTTFTFTINSGTVSPATATDATYGINATDYTDAAFVSAISSLSTSVAAVYPNKITYSVPAGSPDSNGAGQQNPVYWVTNGLGSLTYLGFNLYEPTTANFNTIWTTITGGFTNSQVQLTEWGMDSSGHYIAPHDSELNTSIEMRRRYQLFKTFGIRCYFYNFIDSGNLFGLKQTDGNYRLFWNTYNGERGTYLGNPNTVIPARGASPVRTATPTRGATSVRTAI